MSAPLRRCRQALLRAAAILLGASAGEEVEITLSLQDGSASVYVVGPAGEGGEEGEPPRPEGVPAHWRWLSPDAEKVVEALGRSGGWLTADELARAAGEGRATHEFRGMLRDLMERGIIESAQGRGYRLTGVPAPSAGDSAAGP
jgi:hypothetical protein